jgi:hypothetical protein
MPVTHDQLPDDLNKQQADAEKREANLLQQIDTLLETLRLEKYRRFGASSEKAPGQAELFDEPEHDKDIGDTAAAAPTSSEPKAPCPRPTRKPLPKDLPRVRQVKELSAKELICECGCQLTTVPLRMKK